MHYRYKCVWNKLNLAHPFPLQPLLVDLRYKASGMCAIYILRENVARPSFAYSIYGEIEQLSKKTLKWLLQFI